jgi:hypothetical protein
METYDYLYLLDSAEKSKVCFFLMVYRRKKILATLDPKLWTKKIEKLSSLRLILG